MVTEDYPVVSVWEPDGAEFRLVGKVATYDTLGFEQRYLEPGPWTMAMPYDTQALAVLPHRLLSVDWRDETLGLAIETFNPALDAETQQPMLTVGGRSVLSFLEREVCWPAPAASLSSQPENKLYTGDAESVVRALVSENYVTRRGDALELGTNGNRGTNIKARARFDNLLEIVAKKAKRGGIGVDVVLERTSPMTARLVLKVWTPVDKAGRVRLTRQAGTLREWSQESAAPKATHVLVGGAGEGASRVFRQVSTAKSQTSADRWGGKRVKFVDGPSSFDNPELDQAGEEALDSDAETNTMTFVAAEAEGLRAFTDYQVGDKATGELISGGLKVTDVITSIGVTADDSGIEVKPGFGDPDRKDPAMQLGQLIKRVRRDVRNIITRR